MSLSRYRELDRTDNFTLPLDGRFCSGGIILCRIVRLSCAGFALLMAVAASAGPANPVVYCTTVGVPKGCVALPAVAAPVVVAPAAGPVVACKTRGVPKGCVMR